MSEHEISCVVIRQNTLRQQKLLHTLRTDFSGIRVNLAGDTPALKALLRRAPMLLFYPSAADDDANSRRNQYKTTPLSSMEVAEFHRNERRLQQLVKATAPDCILVRMTNDSWQGLSKANRSTDSGSDTCTLAIRDSSQLKEQLNYLLAYARLKTEFRQCKHLLSINELRNQWLVANTHKAVAYIAANKHLHTNIAYQSLFAFNSDAEARATPILDLIQNDYHEVFSAVSREAEQFVKPSNKLLLNLQNRQGNSFRAEVRLMPAVHRGRRCIQLHIQPLSHNKQQHAQQEPTTVDKKKSSNPWQEQSSSALELQQQKAPTQAANTTALISTDDNSRQRLQADFQELLNLQGNIRPALLRAEPYLPHSNTMHLDYSQLLNRAGNDEARFQLDYRNLLLTLKYLSEHRDSPANQQVIVELGHWALTSKNRVTQLLKLLKRSTALNKQLILALDSDACQQHAIARSLLPLYKASGSTLLLSGVREHTANLAELLALADCRLIQTHADLSAGISADSELPEMLRLLLQQMDKRQTSVIVDGVQNTDALNLLCETTTAYIQGPVLGSFNR